MRAAIVLLLVSAGCIYGDDRPRRDLAKDAPFDRPVAGEPSSDQPAADAPVDRSGSLEQSDRLDLGPRPDRGVNPPDQTIKPKPEGPKIDSPPSPGPCGPGATETFRLSVGGLVLAVCSTGPSGNVQTHCNANGLCASPWKLCTPDQYRTVIPPSGATFPVEAEGAWLSGYVRCGDTNTYDPGLCTAGSCAGCGPPQVLSPAVGFSCDAKGMPLTSTTCNYLGLQATSANCQRVPDAASSYEGYWVPVPTSTTSTKSLCCKAP